jgi:hypothetical protein
MLSESWCCVCVRGAHIVERIVLRKGQVSRNLHLQAGTSELYRKETSERVAFILYINAVVSVSRIAYGNVVT